MEDKMEGKYDVILTIKGETNDVIILAADEIQIVDGIVELKLTDSFYDRHKTDGNFLHRNMAILDHTRLRFPIDLIRKLKIHDNT